MFENRRRLPSALGPQSLRVGALGLGEMLSDLCGAIQPGLPPRPEACILDFQQKPIAIAVVGVSEAMCSDPPATAAECETGIDKDVAGFIEVSHPAAKVVKRRVRGGPDRTRPILDELHQRRTSGKGDMKLRLRSAGAFNLMAHAHRRGPLPAEQSSIALHGPIQVGNDKTKVHRACTGQQHLDQAKVADVDHDGRAKNSSGCAACDIRASFSGRRSPPAILALAVEGAIE